MGPFPPFQGRASSNDSARAGLHERWPGRTTEEAVLQVAGGLGALERKADWGGEGSTERGKGWRAAKIKASAASRETGASCQRREKPMTDFRNTAIGGWNYGEDAAGTSRTCETFLDHVMNDPDAQFDVAKSAFDGAPGLKPGDDKVALLKDYVCTSGTKADLIIDRVGDVIRRLLDRALAVPGLIEASNVLHRRAQLLARLADQGSTAGTALQKDIDRYRKQQLLLMHQLAYMARQLRHLMHNVGIMYDPRTNTMMADDGTTAMGGLVATERFYGLNENELKRLDSAVAAASLRQSSVARVGIQFENLGGNKLEDLPSGGGPGSGLAALLDDVADYVARLLDPTLTAAKVRPWVRSTSADKVVITVPASATVPDYPSAWEQQKTLQQLVWTAFTQSDPPIARGPALETLVGTGGWGAVPNFEDVSGVLPTSPDTIRAELRDNAGAAPGDRYATLVTEGDDPAHTWALLDVLYKELNARGSPISFADLVASAMSPDWPSDLKRAVLDEEEVQKTSLGFPARYYDGALASTPVQGSRRARSAAGSESSWTSIDFAAQAYLDATASPDASSWAMATPPSAYSGHAMINLAAIMAKASEGMTEPLPPLDLETLQGLPHVAEWTLAPRKTKEEEEEEEAAARARERERALEEDNGLEGDDDQREGDGLEDSGMAVDASADLGNVELSATIEDQASKLERIRKLNESSDVRVFARVRPYNTDDLRTCQLQIIQQKQVFDPSPDPRVVQLQLATKVNYNENCLDFSGVFGELPANADGLEKKFHKVFQHFLPKEAANRPRKERWFATVNGGVFFEPTSYADPTRQADNVGLKVLNTTFLKLRNDVHLDVTTGWVKADGTKCSGTDPDKKRIAVQGPSMDDAVASLRQELARVPKFERLKEAWINDLNQKRADLETARVSANDQSRPGLEKRIAEMPAADEVTFLRDYFKTLTTSRVINEEYVDTMKSVTMDAFFGSYLDDGSRNITETKNVVTLFYGASGSGKTFSAEAVMDQVFDQVQHHVDEFRLKIVADYNDYLYDYYGESANAKLKANTILLKSTDKLGNDGESQFRAQVRREMGIRAKLLTIDEVESPQLVKQAEMKPFFEGGKYQGQGPKHPGNVLSKKSERAKGKGKGVVDIAMLGSYEDGNIPKEESAFRAFKTDMDKRVAQFRSVTDTGLNATSSRSHLLYIVERVTKNKSPMNTVKGKHAKGSFFIMADLAGTEDLNYLMSDAAWKLVKVYNPTGECTLAGQSVVHDWACLDLADYAIKKNNTDLKKALYNAWVEVKVKTLAATEISNKAIALKEDDMADIDTKWTNIMKKPYCTTTKFAEKTKLSDITYFGLHDVEATSKSKDSPLMPPTDPTFKTIFELTKSTQTGQVSAGGLKLSPYVMVNPNRFAVNPSTNKDLVAMLVVAMHAESRHINDSLDEIAQLVKAQKQAVEKGTVADLDELVWHSKDNPHGVLTKELVVDILGPAITAGSDVVALGAMNPRRTNDMDTYRTMVNLMDMAGACQLDSMG